MAENFKVKLTGIINEELELSVEKYATFEKLIEELMKKTEGVLTDITINGNNIGAENYEQVKEAYFEGGENIILEFQSKQSVLRNLVKELSVVVINLKENLEKISKEVLLNTQDGHKMLNAMADIFQNSLIVLNNVNTITGNEILNLSEINEVKKVITTIVNSQQNNDTLELSDIIDFDIPQVVDIFINNLAEADRLLKKENSN